jgi:hypothetical protein
MAISRALLISGRAPGKTASITTPLISITFPTFSPAVCWPFSVRVLGM